MGLRDWSGCVWNVFEKTGLRESSLNGGRLTVLMQSGRVHRLEVHRDTNDLRQPGPGGKKKRFGLMFVSTRIE